MDNAIRAAAALDDPQKRFISVSVWEKNGLVLFQFENYYEGTLEFDGALPKTTKDSPSAHGYGLKSIQQTAQKYGRWAIRWSPGERTTTCSCCVSASRFPRSTPSVMGDDEPDFHKKYMPGWCFANRAFSVYM